jgi:hypothetical protein
VSAPDWFCPRPLDCSEVYGTLTIDGESLHRGGWCAFDLSSLYDSPEFRGDNVLVESEEGRVARPVVTDETDYSLPLMFSGAVDPDDAPYLYVAGGLLANREAFTATFVAPIRTGTASLAATLAVPDPYDGTPTAFTFDVQPLRLVDWQLLPNAYATATLLLRVPVPDLLTDPGGEGE